MCNFSTASELVVLSPAFEDEHDDVVELPVQIIQPDTGEIATPNEKFRYLPDPVIKRFFPKHTIIGSVDIILSHFLYLNVAHCLNIEMSMTCLMMFLLIFCKLFNHKIKKNIDTFKYKTYVQYLMETADRTNIMLTVQLHFLE